MTTTKEQNEIELRRRLLESFPDLADFNWCWDNVKLYFIQEGKLQANTEHKKNIQLARECMNFKLIKCNNKDCLNEDCPLWEKE